jgi:hypothetical protein
VTVFDFPIILETTERRVGEDLLGAGPKTVEELRSMAANLRIKYQGQLEEKEKRATQQNSPPTNVLQGAGNVAQGVFDKFKAVSPPFLRKADSGEQQQAVTTSSVEQVTFDDSDKNDKQSDAAPDFLTANSSPTKEAGWANISDGTTNVTTAVGEFCIGDDDDDDDL